MKSTLSLIREYHQKADALVRTLNELDNLRRAEEYLRCLMGNKFQLPEHEVDRIVYDEDEDKFYAYTYRGVDSIQQNYIELDERIFHSKEDFDKVCKEVTEAREAKEKARQEKLIEDSITYQVALNRSTLEKINKYFGGVIQGSYDDMTEAYWRKIGDAIYYDNAEWEINDGPVCSLSIDENMFWEREKFSLAYISDKCGRHYVLLNNSQRLK